MAAIQVYKIDKSFLTYLYEELNLQNEIKEFKDIKLREIEGQLIKALKRSDNHNIEIIWI